MPGENINIEDLRELINAGICVDPLVSLEAYASGQDPRSISELYTYITDLHDLNNGPPDADDWAEIVDMVQEYKYKPVPLETSLKASTVLAEYLHAKRKQIETVDKNSVGIQDIKLDEFDIELVKEIFERDF